MLDGGLLDVIYALGESLLDLTADEVVLYEEAEVQIPGPAYCLRAQQNQCEAMMQGSDFDFICLQPFDCSVDNDFEANLACLPCFLECLYFVSSISGIKWIMEVMEQHEQAIHPVQSRRPCNAQRKTQDTKYG